MQKDKHKKRYNDVSIINPIFTINVSLTLEKRLTVLPIVLQVVIVYNK